MDPDATPWCWERRRSGDEPARACDAVFDGTDRASSNRLAGSGPPATTNSACSPSSSLRARVDRETLIELTGLSRSGIAQLLDRAPRGWARDNSSRSHGSPYGCQHAHGPGTTSSPHDGRCAARLLLLPEPSGQGDAGPSSLARLAPAGRRPHRPHHWQRSEAPFGGAAEPTHRRRDRRFRDTRSALPLPHWPTGVTLAPDSSPTCWG